MALTSRAKMAGELTRELDGLVLVGCRRASVRIQTVLTNSLNPRTRKLKSDD
jgi:hypothetical protein